MCLDVQVPRTLKVRRHHRCVNELEARIQRPSAYEERVLQPKVAICLI